MPNVLIQDRRLSYTARGLLADLLSRPDGWREDARQMADSSPQGRAAIRKAVKELIAAGYYRVVKVRMPDGTIHSEIHVYDTPQPVAPGTTRPGSGGPPVDTTGVLIKNPGKEPSLPALPAAPAEPAAPAPAAPEPDEQTRSAVATLFRVIRPEPRLRLGAAEAGELAPLVSQWLERGGTAVELAQALLPGLPATVHSPAGFLRNRLHRKMPPERIAEAAVDPPGGPPTEPPGGPPGGPPPARYAECTRCHDPVPRPGICRPCAGLGSRTVAVGGGAGATRSGAARVRAALHAARATCAAPG
ncbi:hypothetical protein [Kitasatospora paranensis]|uniref:Helix-turn-helix domain-containing protein n=1 Tax=Kitasatospora paranensis TaxID=258053 RepID=A0ABW2G3B8_9ACTN